MENVNKPIISYVQIDPYCTLTQVADKLATCKEVTNTWQLKHFKRGYLLPWKGWKWVYSCGTIHHHDT